MQVDKLSCTCPDMLNSVILKFMTQHSMALGEDKQSLRPTYECLHDFADHGALPMYLDLIGPQFVLALRQCLGGDWEERFEYHFLALFDMIVYGMKVGWTLQRADEQTKASTSSITL